MSMGEYIRNRTSSTWKRERLLGSDPGNDPDQEQQAGGQMTYGAALGLRGDCKQALHGLTGQRHLRNRDQKDEREKAIQMAINELRDGTLVLVPVRVTASSGS
jgi:hypothetical protein